MANCLPAFIVFALGIASMLADERIRHVQEELRKRNLYFGDVDGHTSPELLGAIRGYQARKGFEATGELDEVTSRSLNMTVVATAGVAKPAASRWPDLPVLKSDAARDLPEPQRFALEKKSAGEIEPSPTPPSEPPSASQDLEPARVQRFVEDYLRDGESSDVQAQLKYYAFPVEYFDHGSVEMPFVERDTRNYVKRWPERKYMLTAPVTFAASGREGETIVQFPIAFSVSNKTHHVTGKTRNFWTVKPEGDDLKIVAVREERIRE
jgi:peptidoglycan hydrolase-like protein with peptidoglycan-binding domain